MDASLKNTGILMFLSRYNIHNRQENAYQECITGKGQLFQGLQTNDAPCKYLLWHGKNQDMPVNKIYCLVSREDLQPIRMPDGSISQESSFTWFQTMIRTYAREQGMVCPEILMLTYDCHGEEMRSGVLTDASLSAVPVEDRASHVYTQLLEAIKQEKPDSIAIDFTGGMRDTSFLLMELSRFLRFMGIPCREIVYSSREDLTIRSLSTAYHMFPLLSGINSFLTTGSASQLQALYRESENSQVSQLLSHLVSFSGAISLCALQDIDRDYQNIGDSLTRLEALEEDGLDLNVLMLKDFVPEIRKKLYLTGNSRGTTYPDLIQWCLDNDLLQQALTLYVEKIPAYLFENGYLRFNSPITPDSRKSGDVIRLGNIVFELSREEKMTRLDLELRNLLNHYKQIQKDEACSDIEISRRLLKNIGIFKYGPELSLLMQDIAECYQADGLRKGQDKPGWMYPSLKKKFLFPKTAFGYLKTVAANSAVKYHCVHPEHQGEPPLTDAHVLALQNLKACMAGKASVELSSYTDLPLPQFFEILLHYLIVRAMRNQVNHAADQQNTGLLPYCVKIGALANEDVNQYTIKDAISAGISQLRTLEI